MTTSSDVRDLSGAELRARLRQRGIGDRDVSMLVWARDDPDTTEAIAAILDNRRTR